MALRILIISDAWHPQINGVVRTYEYLRKELQKEGHTVEVIGPADFAASLPMPFYPEIKLVLRPYRRLTRLIHDFKPDKIHIATEGPLGWAARKFCMRNSISFTTSYHTQFPDYVAQRFAWLIPPLYNAIHARAIQIVRRFHLPSKTIFISTQSLETQLRSWGFTSPMTRMTRGIDTTIFTPQKSKHHDALRKEYTSPVALYVGRVAIEKNLNAFLDMPWDGTKIIVGDGPIRHTLEKKYPKAHFVGKKTGHELADFYRISDVFVFPSKTDTFGIVLIEALACGTPVAAYNVTGPCDIITDNRLGSLDESSLASATQTALSTYNPEYCTQHTHTNYSWKRAGQQFLEGL